MSGALLRWLVGLAAAAALLVPLRAQQDDPNAPRETHERALAAYQAGEYELARELWLTLLDAEGAGIDRADVLYNAGNAAFRARRPLEAAGWYTACLRVAPRREDAWHNLEFVRREAGLDPADRGDLTATARRLVGALTLAESARAVLALTLLLAAALAWEALRGGAVARAASWALAVLLVLALVPWGWQLSRADGRGVFVVQPEGAALLSEPRADAALIDRLAPASEAERIDALPGWLRVRGSAGATGWIAADSVVPLTAPYR